jgi:hypothetical protein
MMAEKQPSAGGVAAQQARVLLVDGHGAFAVDPGIGVATPLRPEDWTALDALAPMDAAPASRLTALPAHQPVFLRWPGPQPEWFDFIDRAWAGVDGTVIRALEGSRRRAVPEAKPAPPIATVTRTPHVRRPGDTRWPLWPVEYHERPQPNLALGLLLAAAAANPVTAERFDARPLGSVRPSTITAATDEPTGILLFSHYVWSTRGNLRLSAVAKAANPRLITVHGGPNVPGYPDDVDAFFADHPHVDVVVHGEGEATLIDTLIRLAETGAPDSDAPDRLACLDGIGGLTYRAADGSPARGPKRKRIAELDEFPSPYLTGVFDDLELAGTLAVVETNRGCPFGCTFCDWGSATRSKVRTYDLDRVTSEIEWLAARGVDGIFVADANFGALPRDLPIAEAVAASKQKHGGPRQVMFTFAKDTAELLIPIVDLLWDAGVDVDGNLALQTVDTQTLQIVRRKNLPQPEYERVRQQFRDRNLPLTSDIMLGLPGSSYEAMKADVQFCLDHEITPRAHRTVLLPNAPMSAPAHRAEHGIVADRLQRTVSGRTFTGDDVARAGNLHRLADAFDHYGIARLPLRFAARDHGLREVDLLERIDELSRLEPDRFPAITWAAVGFTGWLVPPGSWQELLTEFGQWLVADCGLPDDSALRAILAAQAAVLPEPGATFPRRVELEHDVAAWLSRQHEDPGGRDQPRLGTFGPAILEVDDGGRNAELLVANRQGRAHTGRPLREIRRIYAPSWELRHPMARAQMLDVEQHAFRYAE